MSTTVTSSQLFFGKLNEANPTLPHPLTPTNITVGTPTTNANGDVAKNSQVTISGAVGSQYAGTATAYYDRVALSDIIATLSPPVTIFPLTTETKISDLLPVFNQTYNINMVASDIVDGALPAADPHTGQVSFTLAVAATSLAFKGTAALVYQPEDISLTTLPNMVLTGLTVAEVNARAYTPDAEMVLAQVNSDNSSIGRLTSTSNCTVSAVTALTGDASGKDSAVTVVGTANEGFKDSAVFYYDRVGLADIISAAGKTNVVPNTNQQTLADMVASFNTAYSASLLVADLEPADVTNQGNGYMGVNLTPVDGHYLFNAGTPLLFSVSWPTLTLTGTLATPGTYGTAYSSSLTAAGGDGNYSNPVVGAGTLPPGLSLSVSGTSVEVTGNPSALGTYNFTLKVSSGDGQTATSGTQTIAITSSLVSSLTFTALDGLTTSDVAGVSSATALVARINADNTDLPTPLTPTNCTISAVTALSGDVTGKDTSAAIAGTGSPYTTDTVTVKYDRIDLTTLLGSATFSFAWSTQTSSSQLLSTFNTATGALLGNTDIVVENLPTNPNDGSIVNYALKANATSPAFEGQVSLPLQTVGPPTLAGALLPNGYIGTAYSSSLTVSGGTPPYTVSTTSLPPGLTSHAPSDGSSAVTISGTPTGSAAGYNSTITVTDSLGASVSEKVSFLINTATTGPWTSYSTSTTYSNTASNALSNTNTTVTRTATNNSQAMMRSQVNQQSYPIKHYVEWHIDAQPSTSATEFFGTSVATGGAATEGTGVAPGFTVGVASAAYEVSIGRAWSKGASITYGVTLTNGDVLGMAIDATTLSAVKLWWSKNGTWISGNPATGTGPMATLDWSIAGTYPIAMATTNGLTPFQTSTLRSNPSAQSYNPPTGFARGAL